MGLSTSSIIVVVIGGCCAGELLVGVGLAMDIGAGCIVSLSCRKIIYKFFTQRN